MYYVEINNATINRNCKKKKKVIPHSSNNKKHCIRYERVIVMDSNCYYKNIIVKLGNYSDANSTCIIIPSATLKYQ